MIKHRLNQKANDWITCRCGKIFGDNRKGRKTASEKFFNHLRKSPCEMCGGVSKEGNHIIGHDKTDVDEVLNKYYEKGTILC